ncbi:MFS monosaccharide transporter [Fimicolochytrium jonesii]|uniref:MFS monosaccharide transporter n=1 Tax=Fimicolochytrium jonesii TaxID=1396493 RepID=UPI0022FDEE81|nr:MFS monosaccharide transporter [Fimicolochytrium jonesii]KAI8816127.1 MFS monosaccharide transporter [Fimicolochytrium jonesii]
MGTSPPDSARFSCLSCPSERFLAHYVADKFGRRFGIIISSGVFLVGVGLQTASHSLALMVPGRVVAGFGIGLLSDMVPLYQAEAAPKHLRGALVFCYQLAITIGILCAQCVNQGVKNLAGREAYRIPIAIQGRDAHEMQEALHTDAQLGQATWSDCFNGTSNRRTQVGIWLQMFQQLTGVNAVFYFGTGFFKQAGIKEAFSGSTVTGVVNVLSTLPALYLMEKMGRRKLLLMGSAIMLVAQVLVASTGEILDSNSTAGIVMIVFTCMFIFGFASSWGPGAWVVSTEIFPLRIRSKGVALATASNWFWNFLLGFVTPYLLKPDQANLGPKIDFLWAAFILAGMAFVYFCVPETKGKPAGAILFVCMKDNNPLTPSLCVPGLALEDVDDMFDSGIPAHRSATFVPRVKDENHGVEAMKSSSGKAADSNVPLESNFSHQTIAV